MGNLQLLAKGGLIILVVVSLAILIERLTSARQYYSDRDRDDFNSSLIGNSTQYPTVDLIKSLYNESLLKCFLEHSMKPYYYPVNQVKNVSITCKTSETCLYDFLIDTSKLFKSFGIRIYLLEPSVLFCLLAHGRRFNLFTHGFSSSKMVELGMRNIVTCGLDKSDAGILDKSSTRKNLVSHGYRILRFQRKLETDEENKAIHEYNEVSHYFIMRNDQIMHLVVFYPRDSYLLAPALDSYEVSLSGLQYVDDNAFEKFNTSTVYLDASVTAPVLLPSDMRCFLLDMISSEFLKCNGPESDTSEHTHGEVLLALKELKSVLHSRMVSFWLWSKSLQGWHDKCNIQRYTKVLQFAVAAKSVGGFNFSALFDGRKCQYVEQHSNVTNNITSIKLNCHGIPIHLIFMNEDKITFWYEIVNDGKNYRLRFPKFTMCSTDILGQKIGVPCETREILDSECGQFLKNTTLHLNPKIMKGVVLIQ